MDKKILFVLSMSVATFFAFNYFNKNQQAPQQYSTGNVPSEIRPGQAYSVPTAQDLARPVSTEIDFIDKKITQKEVTKEIETDLYKISFSNYGGIISTVDFKKHKGKDGAPLRTIYQRSFYEREEGAFLVALEAQTPYFYNLVDSKENEKNIEVTYQAEVNGWLIRKSYALQKDSYKIDLNLEFEPRKKDVTSIRPRLFYPAPFMGEVAGDVVSGFTIGVDGKSVNKVAPSDLNQAWILPAIFGGEDKYFVHGLVADKQGFVQRGFFKKTGNGIFPVLEGPEINQKNNYQLSFYVGPKLVDDLMMGDERLEDLLEFGWFSWFCKLLLKLLAYIYSLVGNFGVAIILLTILLKLPFVPLTIIGSKKQEEYQKYQPTLAKIRAKYKNDMQKMQQEVALFCKDHNISQFPPLIGCLPMLIQLPILLALYRILYSYLDLYQAPFFGWLTDLSSKDPYYVLPILMGLAMLWSQRLMPTGDDKQKVIMMFMPLFVTAIFINAPAGLVLYWLTNNLLTVGEAYLKKAIFRK